MLRFVKFPEVNLYSYENSPEFSVWCSHNEAQGEPGPKETQRVDKYQR